MGFDKPVCPYGHVTVDRAILPRAGTSPSAGLVGLTGIGVKVVWP